MLGFRKILMGRQDVLCLFYPHLSFGSRTQRYLKIGTWWDIWCTKVTQNWEQAKQSLTNEFLCSAQKKLNLRGREVNGFLCEGHEGMRCLSCSLNSLGRRSDPCMPQNSVLLRGRWSSWNSLVKTWEHRFTSSWRWRSGLTPGQNWSTLAKVWLSLPIIVLALVCPPRWSDKLEEKACGISSQRQVSPPVDPQVHSGLPLPSVGFLGQF